MSFRLRYRIIVPLVAVAAIALFAVPLRAGASTASVPDLTANVSIPLTGVDNAASNANCKAAGKSVINAATPATLKFGTVWKDSGYSSGDKYDYNAASLTGLFDAPVNFTGTEMSLSFTWNQATGAVSRTYFSSQSISSTPPAEPRAKIGTKSVSSFIIGSGDGTGTLTKDATGNLEGTLQFKDFELSIDFEDASLGYGCRLTASTFNIVFGNPTPPTTTSTTTTTTTTPARTQAPVIDLQLRFESGDSVRTGTLPVTTSGGGLAPNAPYTVVLRSDPVQIGSGNAGADGRFINTSPLPADTPPGSHSVTVSSFGPDGAAVQGVGYFTIDARGIVTAISYDGPTATAPAFAG